MKTKVVAALWVALCASTSVASADLRYTTHLTVRTMPAVSPRDPAVEAVGALLKTLAPVRSTRTYLTADAARVERADGDGTATLLRGGDLIVLDRAAETYWRLASFEQLLSSRLQAAPTSLRRTGEHATLAGLRAERIVFSGSIMLPLLPPAGIPTTMAVEGELWVTDAFREYGSIASRAIAVSLPFLSSLPAGLVLRHLIRQPTLGYEIELSVSDVMEEALPRTMFDIPAGYREIPGPNALPLAGKR